MHNTSYSPDSMVSTDEHSNHWHMSPLDIETLLHVYAIAMPFPHPSRAHSQTVQTFLQHDLIVVDDERPCGFRITGRGEKLVDMLCNTPLPQYCDPRISSLTLKP